MADWRALLNKDCTETSLSTTLASAWTPVHIAGELRGHGPWIRKDGSSCEGMFM